MTIKASNFPTVRPTLDLNFAQTKRLDPRVTFSRASSGTYTDVDGLIKSAATNVARFDHAPTTGESLGLLVEEARTNSLIYSERYSASSWTKNSVIVRDNAALAPDGTFTAVSLTETAGTSTYYIFQSGSVTASTTHTFSLFAKGDGSGRLLNLTLQTDAGYLQSYFNLSTGTVSNVSAGLTASIQAVGNGWYRCLVTATTGNTACVPFIYIAAAAGENSVYVTRTGNGVSGILVWGAMRELGSFPTSYIPTPATFTSRSSTATFYDSAGVIQTAASGVARSNAFFPDSNGVFRPAGLLLEAAATNLVTYSEQFDNAAWTKDNVTVTANAVAAPDGLTTADKLVEGTGSYALAATSATTATSVTHTTSVFVKSAERTACYIRAAFGGAYNWVTAKYDLVNGLTEVLSGSSSSFTAPTSSIQKLPNGWWRISCTYTGGGGSPRVGLMDSYSGALDSISGIRFYGGNGTSGIFVWGAQLETGSYATSYIPTSGSTVTRAADTSTSATVTRSADVANMTGTNFSSWFNQLQGSVFCQFNHINSVDVGNYYIGVWGVEADPVNASGFGLSKNDLTGRTFRAQFYFNFNKTGGSTASIELGDNTMPAFVTNKSALVYSSTGVSGAINALLGTNTSSQPVGSATMNTLHLGRHYHSYYPVIINGTIARLAYWPTRLSDTVLQAITR